MGSQRGVGLLIFFNSITNVFKNQDKFILGNDFDSQK